MEAPYYKKSNNYGYTWEPLRATGRCRIEAGGPNQDEPVCWVEHRVWGPFTNWVLWRDVEWHPTEQTHTFRVPLVDQQVFEREFERFKATGQFDE